jgi:hypothetical protein
MLAIKKRFVALEDEKKDERDGYKAEARCDITRADDQTDHRDGGGGDAGDKPVAPDDGAGADEPPRAISGWFAARRCNSWDGPGAIFARIGIAYTANGPRKIFSFQAFLRVRSPGLANI